MPLLEAHQLQNAESGGWRRYRCEGVLGKRDYTDHPACQHFTRNEALSDKPRRYSVQDCAGQPRHVCTPRHAASTACARRPASTGADGRSARRARCAPTRYVTRAGRSCAGHSRRTPGRPCCLCICSRNKTRSIAAHTASRRPSWPPERCVGHRLGLVKRSVTGRLRQKTKLSCGVSLPSVRSRKPVRRHRRGERG